MRINSTLRDIPPVTKHLIIINVLIWLVECFSGRFGDVLVDKLGLHIIGSYLFNPIQILSYMFLHDQRTFMHIFFNMFTLFMFGRLIEQVWGSRRFFIFYMVCGIGAALVQEGVWALTWEHEYIAGIAQSNGLTYDHMAEVVREALAANDPKWIEGYEMSKSQFVTVGASGAIFGLLLAFAFIAPELPMYLFFIPIPIKAKYMVLGYAVLEFLLGVSGGGTIAHFAHLGGMLFGLPMLLYWKKKGTLRGNRFY